MIIDRYNRGLLYTNQDNNYIIAWYSYMNASSRHLKEATEPTKHMLKYISINKTK